MVRAQLQHWRLLHMQRRMPPQFSTNACVDWAREVRSDQCCTLLQTGSLDPVGAESHRLATNSVQSGEPKCWGPQRKSSPVGSA
jgi:hypothetical protein